MKKAPPGAPPGGGGDQPDLFDFAPLGPKSRADQIKAHFKAFHKANPLVWELYKRFTLDIIEAGYDHYSVDSIFERIRWHVNIETRTDDPVKLNNNHKPYYSRMFAVAFPEHDGFFRTRHRTTTEKPAQKNDISVFDTGPAGNESELMRELRDLLDETD